jgi:small subunit ribosomal protein S8
MSMNDPISDMLTRIRNGQRAYLTKVSAPHSNKLKSICDVLEREGFIRGTQVKDLGSNKQELLIELKYYEGEPVIKEIKRISKCGRRHYTQIDRLPKVRNGLGISVLSTSRGVLSDFEARQQHVGGEVICSVF